MHEFCFDTMFTESKSIYFLLVLKVNYEILGHVHNAPVEFVKRTRFHSENASNVFRPHSDAGGIRKRNKHQSFWICVGGKLDQEIHMIIVKPSSSKKTVFNFFFRPRENANSGRRFQIPPV